MGDDFLANLTNLSSGIRGNGENYQPTSWGGGGSAGDSSGLFGGGGSGGFDIQSLLSLIGGNNGGGSGPGGGWLGKAGIAANGIAQLGGLFMGIKQLGLAKDQFKFQKQAYKTNLANQTQSYNTQIQDRINGRSYNTEEERQAALKAAQLPVGG